MQAHSREYHGPINTEQVMLIRCAVGHIPSIRKMGEITTPIATIIARNTMRNVFILCFSILHSSCFSGFLPPELRNEFPEKKRQLSLFRSKFHYFLSLRKHGFPSLCKLLLPGRRALPLRSSLPARNRCTDTFRCAVGFCVLSIYTKKYTLQPMPEDAPVFLLLPSVGMTQIRYGRRFIFLSACHTDSRAFIVLISKVSIAQTLFFVNN